MRVLIEDIPILSLIRGGQFIAAFRAARVSWREVGCRIYSLLLSLNFGCSGRYFLLPNVSPLSSVRREA